MVAGAWAVGWMLVPVRLGRSASGCRAVRSRAIVAVVGPEVLAAQAISSSLGPASRHSGARGGEVARVHPPAGNFIELWWVLRPHPIGASFTLLCGCERASSLLNLGLGQESGMTEDDLDGWADASAYSLYAPTASTDLWRTQMSAAEYALLIEKQRQEQVERAEIHNELLTGRKSRAAERDATIEALKAARDSSTSEAAASPSETPTEAPATSTEPHDDPTS